MELNYYRLGWTIGIGTFGGILSIFWYWGEIGFFSGLIYGLILALVLLIFYSLLFVLEICSTRRIPFFKPVPAKLEHYYSLNHSSSTNASITINLISETATYEPGTYDFWSTYKAIYKTGYGKFYIDKISKREYDRLRNLIGSYENLIGVFWIDSLFKLKKENDVEKNFKKIYNRDILLSRLGLTLWGGAPIWKSIFLFIPFMVNYIIIKYIPIIKPAEADSITIVLWFLHFGILIGSFFLKPLDLNIDKVDIGHRPLHMQILGLFSDYAILRLIQNLCTKYHLIENITHEYSSLFDGDFYRTGFLSNLELFPFAQDIIIISLLEFAIYIIVNIIRFFIKDSIY